MPQPTLLVSLSHPDLAQLLPPSSSSSYQHSRSSMRFVNSQQVQQHHPSQLNNDNDNENNNENDEWVQLDAARTALLEQSQHFDCPYDVDRGYRATQLQFWKWSRPFARGLHASWMCLFVSNWTQFAVAPLLPELQQSLHLTKHDIWLSNLWMMVGGIVTRFVLGPLCDPYGARIIVCTLVALAAIPCLVIAITVHSGWSLTVGRFVLGMTDTFVPSQYWITCLYVREVGATAMALTGGLGATGSAWAQLHGAAVFAILLALTHNNSEYAWRGALILPAVVAIGVAYYFYHHSDDCPLGNFHDVKKAGLMMERSAVDSFRAGAYNINSWILLIQYAASCGVDFTMSNGTALYYYQVFHETTASAGAMAFLYGISALYARALGGWISDQLAQRYSLKGRLYALMVCLLLQGTLNVWLARITHTLWASLSILILFSVLVQMSMGTAFGIVPYIDGPNTGSVAGIVGAGGNVGAVIWAGLFMAVESYSHALEYMGWMTVLCAFFTPLIVVKGYQGIVFGTELSELQKQHSPLLVPGKVQHSPHLVRLQQQGRRTTGR